VTLIDTLGTLYFFLKVLATLLSLWFSSRKMYRWWKRKRNKRKSTA